VQAISLGVLDSLAEGRRLVRQSFPITIYQPRSGSGWEAAYERFEALGM
jgi:rhamnulokinase